jgi:hypothetical protein
MGEVIVDEYVLQRDGCGIHYWIGGPEGRPLVVLVLIEFLHANVPVAA